MLQCGVCETVAANHQGPGLSTTNGVRERTASRRSRDGLVREGIRANMFEAWKKTLRGASVLVTWLRKLLSEPVS